MTRLHKNCGRGPRRLVRRMLGARDNVAHTSDIPMTTILIGPALFEAEGLKIQEELGHLVREIHHVGNALPLSGMEPQKPEVDLLIVVQKRRDNIDAIQFRHGGIRL